jgi:ABC-type phosphate transport system substrate-binding protein
MTRFTLLLTASTAALAASSAAFAQQPPMAGGGATQTEYDYFLEFAQFNASQGSTAPIFNNANASPYAPKTTDEGLFWGSNSVTGQESLLWNNITCNANKTLKNNSVAPYCTAPQNVPQGVSLETIYGGSDSTLTAAQYAGWTSGTSYTDYAGVAVTVPAQQPLAGNLIEVPAQGTSVSFPVVNSGVTTNGQVSLQDSDICGIFSGKITNWSTIAAESYNKKAKIAPGVIQVVYRSDTAAATFIMTEHLSVACPTVSGAPASFLGFTPTQSFSALFQNGTPPSNFVPESGSSAVGNFISGYSGAPYNGSEIGYISPDYTTIDPNSAVLLTNTQGQSVKSTLVVAGIYDTKEKKYVLPTVTNIETALTHVLTYDTVNGASAPPTSVTQAEANNAFVPVPTSVGAGYAYVGYSTFDFAQCYANPLIASALTTFLSDHYKVAAYTSIQVNNGLAPLSATAASKYLTAVTTYILPGKKDLGTEIGSKSACKGLVGR